MKQNDKSENSVFISYRRTNQFFALAVYQNLTEHGYDVFIDYENIGSGDFEQEILSNIRSRAHFLVLLTATALDRCNNPGDWFRLEIETALDNQRNIVPLMYKDFDFENPRISKRLTGKLAALRNYNALIIPATYFDEAMHRLSTRFLNIPITAVLHPNTKSAHQFTKDQQTVASNAPVVTENDLVAEEWLERGYYIEDSDERIHYMDEAIKRKPDYGAAYIFRGTTKLGVNLDDKSARDDILEGVKHEPNDAWGYFARGVVISALPDNKGIKNAIADLSEAIRLEPDETLFYVYRGHLLEKLGDYDGAVADFSEAIRLEPDEISYYSKRGELLDKLRDYDGAVTDYSKVIELGSDDNRYYGYSQRGYSRTYNGDSDGGLKDFTEAILLFPDEPDAYFSRASISQFGKEDYNSALEDYTRCIHLEPEFALYYHNRARLYEDMERYEEAVHDLERFLALDGTKVTPEYTRRAIKKRIRKLTKKVGK